MPFPPLSLHQRISSPGRDLFGKKKASAVPPPPAPPPPPPAPQPDLTTSSSKPGEEKTSSSWASANLRNLGRKPQQESKTRSSSQKQDEPPPSSHHHHHQGKCSWLSIPSKPQEPRTTSSSSPSSSPMDPATKHQEAKKKELQFTLSLTPEAILVIQKRNLEKQMMAKQQKCCAGGDFRHRRVFPSKKAHGAGKSCGSGAPKPEPLEQDITAIVKISLLNDQYKYDDVEYEDEDGDVDETVVRKCKEWLKGVENAAALGKVDNKLSALPHLKGC